MTRTLPKNFQRRLEGLAGRRLDLTWTTNASTWLSFAPGLASPLPVHLHRAFLYASSEVVAALADWLAGRCPRCPAVVRRFVQRPPAAARRMARTPPERLQPRGRCYDLDKLLRSASRRAGRPRVGVRITWGRRIRQRAVYARTLGAYYVNEKLIVMNPVLDQWAVPEWFLAYTVYHEALHVVQPPGEPLHGPWFERALSRHPHHAQAVRWERANVRLLTDRPRDPRPPAAPLADPRRREHLDF